MKRKNLNDSLELIGRGKLFLLIAFGTAFIIWFIIYMDTSYRDNLKRTQERKSEVQYFADNYNNNNNNRIIFKGEKIVHLDLKGAPPKISYYNDFFNLIVKLGATGVIIEYEDMFPYHGKIGNISALNAYSLNDIKKINDIALNLKLKIIPLVQTFGHLEFLLKGLQYQHLREAPKHPQVICPSNDETLPIIIEMVTQVIKAHPNSEMIHIGADEVYIIGECSKCYRRMFNDKLTKMSLFLEHVTKVARKIKEMHPKIRILVWDDEFRKAKREDLQNAEITKLVEPVVWSYVNDVYIQLGPRLWSLYESIFPKIWIASAFKGSTGSNKYTTDIEYHLENHRAWMQVVEEYSTKIPFEGIILTGWQRYDHFSVLCELLPVGIPSLAMCLHHIMGITSSPLTAPKETASILQCKNAYALLGPELGSPKCEYPGGDILEGVLKVQLISQELNTLLDSSTVHGWMSDYNIKYGYSNAFLIESTMDNLNLLQIELVQVEKDLRRDMENVYDNYTINEWCETVLQPISKKMRSLWMAKENLLDREVWPKRPFP